MTHLMGPFEPDDLRRRHMPAGWGKREMIIRRKAMFDETCWRCGEARLMWRLDFADGEVKLFKPYSFHVCPDGGQALAIDKPI